MKSADAIHLASAIRMDCHYFMTHDQGFPIGHTTEGVQVVRPQPVWQESLFEQ
jgi:predicted nucleic acid-binding protein